MSLTNLNNNIYPLTLDGLQTAYLDNLYINNTAVVPSNLVPYTGATSDLDLNKKNLTNTNTLSTTTVNASGSISAGTVCL